MSSEDMLGGGFPLCPRCEHNRATALAAGRCLYAYSIQEWYPLQTVDPHAGQNMHTYR